MTRFIRRISVGKNGEKASDCYELDKAAIEREERYDGYYAVATNLEDSTKSIRQTLYNGKYSYIQRKKL